MKIWALFSLAVASCLHLVSGALLVLCQECRGSVVGFGLSGFLSVLTIWIQFRWDLLALPSVFILAYFLYSLIPGLFILVYERMPELYPVEVDFEAIFKALALAAEGAIAFSWATLLFAFLSRSRLTSRETQMLGLVGSEAKDGLKYLFWIGLGAWFFGFVLSLVDLVRVGGLSAVLMPRVERLSLLSEVRGSIPYATFLFPGIALSGYAVWRMRQRAWLLLWLFLAFVWIFWLLLQGDRRFLLYTVLMSLYVYLRQQGRELMVTPRMFALGLLLYALLMSFGHMRWLLTELLTGKMSLPEAIKWVGENASLEWLLPQNTEFAGPYFTLLYSLEVPVWAQGVPLWGQSYLWAILGILPRSLYPGEKPLGLSFDFSYFIWTNFQGQFPAPIGWGFSPLAEAYLNGGALMVAVWFAFLGVALSLLERSASRARNSPFRLGVAAFLFVQMLNFQRIDFIWVVNEMFWIVVGFSMLYTGWIVVKSIRAKMGI